MMENKKEEQVIVYDRQIRLWGLEAQTRLENAHIVIAGCLSSFACEVIKNLALAGVGKLTIIDSAKVTFQDVNQNFLIQETDLGENRSFAIGKAASKLNPFITINSLQQSIHSFFSDPSLWSSVNVLILFEPCSQRIAEANKLARHHNICFFAAHQGGIYGWIFIDLQTYSYSIDSSLDSRASSSDHVESIQTFDLNYPSFEEAILGTCSFSNSSSNAIQKRLTLPFLFSWAELRASFHQTDIYNEFESLCNEYQVNFKEDIRPYIEKKIELPYLGAYLGGLLAQETVKVIQRTKAPLMNFLVHSIINSPGFVYHLGPVLKTIPQSKVESYCLD